VRRDELASLLGPPFVLGTLAGALLASGALRGGKESATADEVATAEVGATEAVALRLEARVEELRETLSSYEPDPLRDLIEAARKRDGGRERTELIARIAAADQGAIQAVEAAAERARSRYARGLYLALLFRGTKEKRWLDDLLAAADMRTTTESSSSAYWEMLDFALELETLDEDARMRVLDFLATRTPQEAASALALRICMGCYAPEQFKTPATYYALIQRLRDHALGDATASAMLASLSPEAYVATLAKLLSSESVHLARRTRALESHRLRADRLAEWNPALAATLPKQLEPQEWQRWIAAHDALVTQWMEPDLVKSHGL
jgi:hypothetical protein